MSLVPDTVAGRLAAVREDLAAATVASARAPGAVRLVAVSKRVPIERVVEAAAAGQLDFGENYLQDALPRIEQLAGRGLCWHMLGRLQSNKAARAARAFDLMHGIDSLRAARSISRAMCEDGTVARLLVQIRLGGGDQRGGIAPADAQGFVSEAALLPGLELAGVMGVAPHGAPAREHFSRLRETGERLRALALATAPMTEISAGMSADWREAVAEGATMVRIGTAIFGERPA